MERKVMFKGNVNGCEVLCTTHNDPRLINEPFMIYDVRGDIGENGYMAQFVLPKTVTDEDVVDACMHAVEGMIREDEAERASNEEE